VALIEYRPAPRCRERFRTLTGDCRRAGRSGTCRRWPPIPLRTGLPAEAGSVSRRPGAGWEHIEDEVKMVGELAATGARDGGACARELDRRVDALLETRRLNSSATGWVPGDEANLAGWCFAGQACW